MILLDPDLDPDPSPKSTSAKHAASVPRPLPRNLASAFRAHARPFSGRSASRRSPARPGHRPAHHRRGHSQTQSPIPRQEQGHRRALVSRRGSQARKEIAGDLAISVTTALARPPSRAIRSRRRSKYSSSTACCTWPATTTKPTKARWPAASASARKLKLAAGPH